MKIIEDLNIERHQYKFGAGKVTLGFTQDEVEAIKIALEAVRKNK